MKFAILLLIALLVACTSGPEIAGGGGSSETTNSVCALILGGDGEPVAEATVRMRRADYVTPLPAQAKAAGIIGGDARTDSRGRFLLTGIEPGEYRIEVGNDTSAVLLECTIGVTGSVDLGLDTLRPLAVISGVVDSFGTAGFVRVQGLERLVRIDSAGRFIIADLPEGTFDLNMATGSAGSSMMEVANIKAVSGDTTTVAADARWSHSRRLYINTTASGAGVSEDVTGFPLLVRLDGSNFDFSQARDAGQDVRFVKDDGSELPFEIEQWDRAAEPQSNRAAVWVNVDTIRGNSDRQFITMLWGESGASAITPQSNGAAVFDTANGFSGVWHLSEEQPDTGTPDLYKDATANRFHGSDGISSPLRDGVIGFGHGFDSTRGDRIDLGTNRNFLSGASAVTLDAWVWSASDGINGGTVITHSVNTAGDPTTSFAYLMGGTRTRVGGRCAQSDTEQAITSDTILATGTWYHVAGMIDYQRDSLYLFVNGRQVLAGSGNFSLPALPGHPSTASAMGSGEYPYDRFFHGALDEVRTQRVRRSTAWIKLCYENQRPGSGVVSHRTR